MKEGFTLIELLVVVLIIAILSALALPQYVKTVEKTRAAEALLNLKALADSANRYWLANNGDYFNMCDDRKNAPPRRSQDADFIVSYALRNTPDRNYSLDIDVPDDSRFAYFIDNNSFAPSPTATIGALRKNLPENRAYSLNIHLDNGEITLTECQDMVSGEVCKSIFNISTPGPCGSRPYPFCELR